MELIVERTNLISLRRTKEVDLEFVINAEQETENTQFVGQWTREEHAKSLSDNDTLHLIVEDSITNSPLGYIIMAGLKNSSYSIEFRRFVICTKGKGIGREALRLVKKVAFEQLQAHRLWLDVRCKNFRAQKLYKSEGFINEGVLRECVLLNGTYESLIIMSILKDEYYGF